MSNKENELQDLDNKIIETLRFYGESTNYVATIKNGYIPAVNKDFGEKAKNLLLHLSIGEYHTPNEGKPESAKTIGWLTYEQAEMLNYHAVFLDDEKSEECYLYYISPLRGTISYAGRDFQFLPSLPKNAPPFLNLKLALFALEKYLERKKHFIVKQIKEDE